MLTKGHFVSHFRTVEVNYLIMNRLWIISRRFQSIALYWAIDEILVKNGFMPCPSMGPNHFGRVYSCILKKKKTKIHIFSKVSTKLKSREIMVR